MHDAALVDARRGAIAPTGMPEKFLFIRRLVETLLEEPMSAADRSEDREQSQREHDAVKT